MTLEILYDKNNILLTKENCCNYNIHVDVNSPLIHLTSMFSFEWLKVLLDIQGEFIQEYEIFKIDEDNAKVYILLRHFFKDFGICPFFFFVKVHLERSDSGVSVYQNTEYDTRPIIDRLQPTFIQIPINDCHGKVNFNNPHSITIDGNLHFEYYIKIPTFIEKMGILLCIKLIRLLKDFAEKLYFLPNLPKLLITQF